MKPSISIFEIRDCLTMGEINIYLEDKATEDERFSIENHLVECELCSAVIKGYSKSDQVKSSKDLSEINEILQKQFAQSEPANIDTKHNDELEEVGGENLLDTEEEVKTIQLDSTRGKFNWAIAAIGITLLGLALWTYSNRPTQQDLFSTYFEPYAKGLIATRSESGENATAFSQGLERYENSDFKEALTLLEKGLENDPENGQANFYAGLAALEGNNMEKAIQYLKMTRINHSQYYGSATWYLAMSYLKQGEQDLAAETLKGLSENDAPYFIKGLRLLREIQQ